MGDDRQEKIISNVNSAINKTYSYLEVYTNKYYNLVDMYFDNLDQLDAIERYQAKDHETILQSLDKWKMQLA